MNHWLIISVPNWVKISLLAVGLGLIGLPAQAADWSIQSFNSIIDVSPDASISVSETIVVNFNVAKRGIYRNIPFRYNTDQGSQIQVPIEIQSVTIDGDRASVSESTVGDELELKIGKANETITGRHTYVINYTAAAAVNFFTDYDELYWNATGDNWEVPLGTIEITTHLPEPVAAADVKTKCFTGPLGSTSQNCQASATNTVVTFSAQGEPLTIVVGWPKGIVTKPDNYDQLRATAAGEFNLPWLPWPWLVAMNGAVLIGGLWLLVWWWRSRGRDPIGKQTIVAQYDPPPNLTPGEMGVLFDERADQRDLTATIIDLAVHGYLDITEITKEKLLGLSKSKDYTLNLKQPNYQHDVKLQVHEKSLLDGLFEGRQSVDISDLKGTFYKTVKAINDSLYGQVATKGYYVSDPQKARNNFLVLGIIIMVIGFGAFAIGLFVLPLLGLITIIFSRSMPKRTTAGVEAFWHARGFKLFLEKAEKYRLQWQEKKNIFEQYLPYAMAFGVAEKWSKAFAGIQQQPPSWYHGSGSTMFNTLVLWSALNSFSTTTTHSFSPPAASGGSGFGGGGFSGGGFGGGGGGSW